MADKLISDLPQITNVDDNCLVPVQTQYGTRSIKATLLSSDNSGEYEPVIIKNTAFNKNFETVASNIKMDGIQSVGSSNNIARADHVHPSDTTKVDKVIGKSLILDTEIARLSSLTNYYLPTASSNVLGGVKIGAGLTITNGVVSTTGGGVADSIEWSNVQNKPTTYPPSTHTHPSDVTKIDKSDIINDPTIGGTTKVASAESVKTLKTSMNGVAYFLDETVSNIEEVDNIHTHSNLNILNNITQSKFDSWDAKANNIDNNRLTNAKDVTGSLNELFTNVSNGKILIATAISDMGVSASSSDTFQVLASKIRLISTGGGTISVTGVSLNKSTITIIAGGYDTLVPTITPLNATNKNVTWSSNNTSIATVNNGVVTAVNTGTTTIICTTIDGNYSATCNVTVQSQTINVTGISLNKSSTTISSGSNETLVATVLPSNASNKSVTWTSSNTGVATVNSSGVVTGVNSGSAIITVRTVDGNYTANCSVTVPSSSVPVTSVSLNKSTLNLNIGNTETLIPTVLPENATNKAVTWSSNNTSIATVDSNGKVTAIAQGTTTITVTTVDGSKTYTCGVVVSTSSVSVTGITLNKSTTTITAGNTEQLTETITPSNASNKNVNWSSNNTGVATVNASGLITAISQGSATITATTVDGGKTATCSVTVQAAIVSVTGVSLNKSTSALQTGSTEQLTATISPSNATNKSVTWSSNNTGVVSVSSSGLVTANGVGSATITVTTADGNKTATCSYTVTSSATNTITVSPTSYNITGNTLTVNYTTNVTLTDVRLSTNNGTSYDIASTTFNQTSATFNVTSADGTYTCKLRGSYDDGQGSGGTISVSSVNLDKSTISLNSGGSTTLTANIVPSNATNQTVSFSSNPSGIVSITVSGLTRTITANSTGTTTITVTTSDGNKTATCNVTVSSSGGGTGEQWTPTLSQFGIYNDGTNAQATSDGLNAMIEYASANSKNYIKMPAGTYLIQKDTPVNLKSNITLDLNGSTFKMETNNKSGYQILILKEVSNVTIKGGTLEGDRYTHDYTGYDANTNSHEFGISIRLDQAAENCIIENMTIKKLSGYGIYTAQGQGYGTTIKLDRDNKLESGSYNDSGVKITDGTKIRYSEGVNISGFASLGYFQVGTYLKYQNFLFNSTRTVTALVFNASNVLVKKVTTQLYRPIEIPADARTAYLIFHQSDPKDLLGDNSMYPLDVFHMKPNKNCIIRNNVFDDNRCLGLAVCGGWNLLVENNQFKNTSKDPATVGAEIWQAGKPGYGIDIEDGWEGTEDLNIKGNTFTNNWFGDIVAMAGDGMVIENNTFDRNMHCYSRMTNYTVRNNTWTGGGANYDTEKDHGCTAYGNIYNNVTISGEYYKQTGFENKLNYYNETVNGGKFINHKSMLLKDSSIDLKGAISTPFQGSFYNCTIKDVDGTTTGSKHNGIVMTGTYCDKCTITNSAFFPNKESVFKNGSLSGKRIRMDGGTLEVTNNTVNSTVIVLNAGTSAIIKDNKLSGMTGSFITNAGNVPLEQSNNV